VDVEILDETAGEVSRVTPLAGLILAQVLGVGPAPSNEPTPSVPGNEAPFTVVVTVGAVVTLAGDVDAGVQPTTFVNAEGPIIIGDSSIGRVMVEIGLTTEPGLSAGLADPRTFRSAAARLAYGYVIGDNVVQTVVGAEYGFDSRLNTGNVEPLTRLSRHYAATVTLRDPNSGSGLAVGYGRDEACGARRYGQIIAHGDVALPGGLLRLTGDASLSIGPRAYGNIQRDVFKLGIVADVGAIFK
jgi:hypothetical protein